MAVRRMFAKSIIDSDDFLDLPLDVQLLYFHLGMQADDEGLLNNTRKIVRTLGVEPDTLQILCDTGFLIPFPSGVMAIRHWHVSNKLRKDRRIATQFQAERDQLMVKFDVYEYGKGDDNQMTTQEREGEDRAEQWSGVEGREEKTRGVERSEGEKNEEKKSAAQPNGGEETRLVAPPGGFSTNPQTAVEPSVGVEEKTEFFDVAFQRKKEEALERLRNYEFQPLPYDEPPADSGWG